MIEQFNFDIRLIFAILNGKVSAAINRKLYRNFRQNGLEISPEQWTVLIFLWEKDGVTQQELCNATFKDKPSMTRLIDNMERQHLVVLDDFIRCGLACQKRGHSFFLCVEAGM